MSVPPTHTSDTVCTLCPSGTTVDNHTGMPSCISCGPGHYIPEAGSTGPCSSYGCPAGTSDVDSNASTPCVSCPSGSYSAPASSGNCTLCPAGSTDDDSNPATPCVSCPAGTYVPSGSTGACSNFQCAAGTVDADNSSSTACVSCGPGYYIPNPGTTGPCTAHACLAGTTDLDSNPTTPCSTCPRNMVAPVAWHGNCTHAPPHPPTRRRFFVGTGGYDPAQAMAYCAANGGQLASIRNSSELYLLGSLKPQPDRSNGMWIGGHRVAISAPYHWLDGWTATTPYNYFCNGEPQNVEYYVSFWSSGSCIEDFCYQAK